MKILPVGAKFFHADGQQRDRETGMTKLTVAFRSFANSPKMSIWSLMDIRPT